MTLEGTNFASFLTHLVSLPYQDASDASREGWCVPSCRYSVPMLNNRGWYCRYLGNPLRSGRVVKTLENHKKSLPERDEATPEKKEKKTNLFPNSTVSRSINVNPLVALHHRCPLLLCLQLATPSTILGCPQGPYARIA